MTPASRAAIMIFALVMCPSCSSKPDYSPNPIYRSTRFPQTRTESEAKLWLHWSTSERLAFVRAFVIGYRQGSDEGCQVAERAAQPSLSESICWKQTERLPSTFRALFYDDEVSQYSRSMTTFYESYPEDDDVPITFLLESIVFEQKTPVQVHNLLPSRNP